MSTCFFSGPQIAGESTVSIRYYRISFGWLTNRYLLLCVLTQKPTSRPVIDTYFTIDVDECQTRTQTLRFCSIILDYVFFYFQRKTKTQRRNLSPVFEETLEYFLPAGEVRRKRLEVSVFHDSRYAHLQNHLFSCHDCSVECTKECTKMEIDLREIEHTCV